MFELQNRWQTVRHCGPLECKISNGNVFKVNVLICYQWSNVVQFTLKVVLKVPQSYKQQLQIASNTKVMVEICSVM